MSQSSDNPYQSPQTPQADASTLPDNAGLGLREKVKRFRQQMHALGAFWILCGVLNFGAMVFLGGGMLARSGNIADDEIPPALVALFLGISGVVATAWLTAGVLTLLKQLWAVTLGLVVSYVALVGAALGLNICGIVLLVLVVIQGHRVLRWGKELLAAGVPLTTKPHELNPPGPEFRVFGTETN